MSAKTGRITSFLQQAPLPVFTAFAIAASFSTYFCMYAFRKPFVAASFLGADGDPIKFWSSAVDLKSALVISQILGYTLSKYIGIKICSEVTRARRATMLIAMILLALAALILYGVLPDQWKFVGIFLGGLPLGMVWGLVVWYLEGRTVSEVLLAGLSCSFIVASGVVRDVGRHLMGDWGVTEGWMPALTGGLFLIPFFISVWLLNQLPRPTERDELARTHREPMRGSDRVAFVRSFFWGLLMLAVAYFFLTAYREYRDIYQGEMFAALEYPYDAHKTIITKAETLVAFGVLIPLGLLFLIRNNRWGLIGTYSIMVCGLVILGGSTWALENNHIDGFWWMTLVGLGAYLAYVPYGSVLFDRLMASTHVVGTAVFAIYIMDALGYTGSVAVLIYRDCFYVGTEEPALGSLEFFIDFSYFMAAVGLLLLIASGLYFLAKSRSGAQNA